MDKIFEKLVTVPSISGDEELMQGYIDKVLKNIVEESEVDLVGNNIKKIGKGKTKVMITAHADEVGFIVTYIDEKGYIYFKPVGGIDNDITIGQDVRVLTSKGSLYGIIGRDPQGTITKESSPKEMWIDIGAGENTADFVSIGDRVYFGSDMHALKNNCYIARGADNKVGVYTVIGTVKKYAKKQNKNLTVFPVFTAQEEVGSQGAKAVIDALSPKYSFVIDAIDATDTPGASIEEQGMIKIGSGPVISVGASVSDTLFQLVKKTAQKEGIPHQIIAEAQETSTDVDFIQTGAAGVISMVFYIPVRYMHTPHVLFSWDDIEAAIALVTAVLHSVE